MTEEIVWKSPPRAPRVPGTMFAEALELLPKRPGVWARIDVGPKARMYGRRQALLRKLSDLGKRNNWEVRTFSEDAEGTGLYARFLGSPREKK